MNPTCGSRSTTRIPLASPITCSPSCICSASASRRASGI
jgi:hypothetical protein